MTTRTASHAGSWYSSNPVSLSRELENWLSLVPKTIDSKPLPVPNARLIIAPHAGYTYSGSVAAYAYAALSITPNTKRIFLLGPSHTLYFTKCALTSHSFYATPFGNLKVDAETVGTLDSTGRFDKMSLGTDEDEHSLEMHLPYIYHMISHKFDTPAEYPLLVPILVGNTSASAERRYGRLLAPYLADSSNVFIVSSDFCHWGLRFNYTYYLKDIDEEIMGYDLTTNDEDPTDPLIHESITKVDRTAMNAIEKSSHNALLQNLRSTGNTVCGRHPISVLLAALEALDAATTQQTDTASCEKISDKMVLPNDDKRRFKFIKYEKSGEVMKITDSSVSYASAYAEI